MARKYNSGHYNPEDLLQSGIDHLSAASLLLKSNPSLFDSAGYLAHMGIELIIKSWLLHQNSEFEAIHSLPDLIKEIKKIYPEFFLVEKEQQTIDYLSNFVELRYPSKNNPTEIGSEDTEQIYELANKLWKHLPDELINAYENITKGKKGNRFIMKRPTNIPRNLEFETGIKEK